MAKHPGQTILILTKEHDTHAKIVGRALEERGHRVFRWIGNDYPNNAHVTIRYERKSREVKFENCKYAFDSREVDVVWNRRATTPVAPTFINELDREFVVHQVCAAVASINSCFEKAFWINKARSSTVADWKALQLSIAQKVGFRVPCTIISNDPHEIRRFIADVGSCIYKALDPYIWKEGGHDFATYTSNISIPSLPSEPVLRATPGIFQEKITKSYEVRVQFFGASYLGVIIESNRLEFGDVDWRIGQSSIKDCKAAMLPKDVYSKCLVMMRELDIVSGAFDFIVNSKDEWIFLEINEAGQFLFIENWCRKLRILDAFCQFVESANKDFQYVPSDAPLRLNDVNNRTFLRKTADAES